VVLALRLEAIVNLEIVWVVTCVFLVLLCILCVIVICRQPESKEALTFKVPDVLVIEFAYLLCHKSLPGLERKH